MHEPSEITEISRRTSREKMAVYPAGSQISVSFHYP
jgi:hypothetical protein